jgi:hypothetical protein
VLACNDAQHCGHPFGSHCKCSASRFNSILNLP